VAEDLRHRYAEALANAECEKQPRCVNCMADAVMAVRDEELQRLRYELEEWHAAYGEKALPGTMARLRNAEAAVARVRRLCEITIAVSCRVQAIDQARDTLAALDSQEAERG